MVEAHSELFYFTGIDTLHDSYQMCMDNGAEHFVLLVIMQLIFLDVIFLVF